MSAYYVLRIIREVEMEKKELEMLIIGFGSGLLVGSLLSMLLTPYSGRELRMKLADIADDITNRVNRFKEPEKYTRIKP